MDVNMFDTREISKYTITDSYCLSRNAILCANACRGDSNKGIIENKANAIICDHITCKLCNRRTSKGFRVYTVEGCWEIKRMDSTTLKCARADIAKRQAKRYIREVIATRECVIVNRRYTIWQYNTT